MQGDSGHVLYALKGEQIGWRELHEWQRETREGFKVS